MQTNYYTIFFGEKTIILFLIAPFVKMAIGACRNKGNAGISLHSPLKNLVFRAFIRTYAALFLVDNDGGGVVVAADDCNGLAGFIAIEA